MYINCTLCKKSCNVFKISSLDLEQDKRDLYLTFNHLNQKSLNFKIITHLTHAVDLFLVYKDDDLPIECQICNKVIYVLRKILDISVNSNERFKKYSSNFKRISHELDKDCNNY